MKYRPKSKPEKTNQVCPVCGMTITEYSAFAGVCLKGHSLKPPKQNENDNKNRDFIAGLRKFLE